MLALDLGLFHRQARVVSLRESLIWSGVWVLMALIFAGVVRQVAGTDVAMDFLTGYLIEKSLSIDNVFVFALIFAAMKVPRACEHKVLFWGVFGALVMRFLMIYAGVALLERFHWLLYVFGAVLIYSAVKMVRDAERELKPDEYRIVRLFRRLVPSTSDYRESRFWVREGGRWIATPLLLVLIFVEWSDVVFAVDSIPAILAVTRDPFIVFSANAMAILGLRSLYFALAGLMERFRYLHYGLAGILGFVGLKMFLMDVYPIPGVYSLMVILTLLTVSVLLSWLRPAARPHSLLQQSR
jgi:tellurite resistance protein TerC